MSVRNRIAMFEQTVKETASPEDRGRSPGGVSSTGTASPRPLSKVRTSFVAIERSDGRIGLQRQASTDSSISGRKLSGDTEATSTILVDSTRTNVSSPDAIRPDFKRGPSSSAISCTSTAETGPTFAALGALANAPSPGPSFSGTAIGVNGPSVAGTKQTGLAESPQIRQAPRAQGTNSGGRGPSQLGLGKENEGQIVLEEHGDKGQGKIGKETKAATDDNSNRPGGGSGEPVNGSVPSTGNTTTTVTKAPNGVEKTREAKPATTPVKPVTPSSQPRPAGKVPESVSQESKTLPAEKPEKKPASTNVSPNGFVKPRPKSPTRPVKLPASLTTHTAASGSRTRNQGNAPTSTPSTRPTRTTQPSSGKALGRSASVGVASRQRPSIGPPPKQVAKDHPVPKKEAKVDEGFLARMMRPTQASASKVAEKVPTTPPRKTNAPAAKKSGSAKSGPAKRVVSRSTSTTGSPETMKKEGSSAAKEIVPKVVPKASQKPNAEETITVSKRVEGNTTAKTSKENAVPEIPKTPERQPAIPEEKEEQETVAVVPSEKMNGAPKASEAPVEAQNEPQMEHADVPVTNGHHKEDAVEQPGSQSATIGQVQEEEEL